MSNNLRRPELTEEQLQERRMQRRQNRAQQTYRLFIKNLCRLGSMSEEIAERAAGSVLCALEQRVLPEEMRHLEAQLPIKLLNLMARCERHVSHAPEKFGRDEFIDMIAHDLGMQASEVEPVIRAVFAAVRDQITEGEFEDVMRQLPNDLRELFQRNI